MKINFITQFIIPQQAGIWPINLQLATLLTSEILLVIESLANVFNIFSIQMLNENIDYMLMMQNTMILANCNPCEAFVMVMTKNEHDENKNRNNIAE